MEEFHDPGIHYFYFGWTAYGLLKKKIGDSKKLDSPITASLKDFTELCDRWFTSRNKRWLAEIKKLIGKNENIFIVVGAGHLVGRDGLVELLKKQNYNIRQR